LIPKQLLTKKKNLVSHTCDFDVDSVMSCSAVNSHHEAHDTLSADLFSNNECFSARSLTKLLADKEIEHYL